MSEGSRRRVTYAQLETLWEFLNAHKEIATGYNKTARARDSSKKMWNKIAQALNAHGDGAVKDWKGWSKYWNDYKSKLKKSVATIRASQQRTGGGPSEVQNLSNIEERFLQILGDSFGAGLPGVRVEPFKQVPETEIEDVNETVSQSLIGSTIILENIHEDSPQPGPSRLPSTPPRSHSEPVQLTPAQSPRQQQPNPHTPESRISPLTSTPRRSPRRRTQTRPETGQNLTAQLSPLRRRRRRREPPISQKVARRNLIAISNERSQQGQARNDILKQLVQEIRDIKDILRTRLPVPELPETPILN